jgi:hypothetical protein
MLLFFLEKRQSPLGGWTRGLYVAVRASVRSPCKRRKAPEHRQECLCHLLLGGQQLGVGIVGFAEHLRGYG